MYVLITKNNLNVAGFLKETLEETSSYIVLEVPENLDPDCVKAVLIDDVITLVEDIVKTAAKIIANKQVRIAALNQTTWNTILTEAATVYSLDPTGKSQLEMAVLISAAHSTYQDMVSHPASYVGDMFADQAAVLAYAEPKLAASSAFGKWRIGILVAEAIAKQAILDE